ncbi:MAG: RHS repeat protein [Candidatus Schekmanbacteria bacterium]|nr:RHS repeat protein [Candidatus Schekmanbacteria bacterium]
MTTRNPSVVPELSYTYTYDAEGQVLRITDGLGEHVYAYDAAGRLTGADHPDGGPLVDEWYAYDALGRRTASHLSGTYEYDAAGRLVADDAYAYAHDANGQLSLIRHVTDGEEIALAYDALGRNTGIRRRRSSDGEILNDLRFSFDGADRRADKEDLLAGEREQIFYDQGNLIRVDNGGGATESYTYAEGIDELLSGEIGGTTLAYARNERNDVVAVTADTGAIVRTYAYDSFGAASRPDRQSWIGSASGAGRRWLAVMYRFTTFAPASIFRRHGGFRDPTPGRRWAQPGISTRKARRC